MAKCNCKLSSVKNYEFLNHGSGYVGGLLNIKYFQHLCDRALNINVTASNQILDDKTINHGNKDI